VLFFAPFWALIASSRAAADPPTQPLTVEAAVAYAVAHHPAVDTARAQEQVQNAQVDLARTALLPQAGLVAQLNRGTDNVVPGSSFLMPGIPSMSGAARGRDFTGGEFGSALGVWAAWGFTDLPRRMAITDMTLAQAREAQAATAARALIVGYEAADLFVTVITAMEIVRASEVALERTRVFAGVVHVLVGQQLRPGADEARADAEVALAEAQLATAQQMVDVSNARFATALGVPGETLHIDPGGLLTNSPVAVANSIAEHPELRRADAAIEAARAQVRAVGWEYLPRVDGVASLWGRGSGYFPGGANLGAAQGLVPDAPNWAAGIVVSWPVMEMFATRARDRIATSQVHVAQSRRREVEQALSGQLAEASAILEGARRVALTTGRAVVAARAGDEQARARYNAGLSSVVDVADAQRVLTSAEVQDINARLAVRRAQLLVARATGDLTPFLLEADGASSRGR
jgi:outer membrane protein TolC